MAWLSGRHIWLRLPAASVLIAVGRAPAGATPYVCLCQNAGCSKPSPQASSQGSTPSGMQVYANNA